MVDGRTLVPDLSGSLNTLLQTFGTKQQRDERDKAEQQKQQLNQMVTQLPDMQGPEQQRALARIAAIDPKIAKTMNDAIQRGNEQELAAVKAETERGLREASFISGQESYSGKINALRTLAEQAAAEGRPVERYLELANKPEAQLDLELQRMQIMGTDIDNLVSKKSPTAIMQNLEAAGYKPGTPEYQQALRNNLQGVLSPEALAQKQQLAEAGRSSTSVNVSTGSDKFNEEVAKGDASRFQTLLETAQNASRNRVRIDRLDQLLQRSGSGIPTQLKSLAGDFGIQTEGLSDIQAAEAIINSLIPEQRPAGSGVMSDADLEMFKSSLPRLINTPEGNRKIIETMKAINVYDRRLGQIASQAMSGEISRNEAREKMMEVPNPLRGFSAGEGGRTQTPSGPPEGVDEQIWNAMTDEEKALWQN